MPKIEKNKIYISPNIYLYSNNKIDCSKVIAPIQWQSNCWFNSGFMINYVSDKGRKFFRYFRELMITGKTFDGKKIDKDLTKLFFTCHL